MCLVKNVEHTATCLKKGVVVLLGVFEGMRFWAVVVEGRDAIVVLHFDFLVRPVRCEELCLCKHV